MRIRRMDDLIIEICKAIESNDASAVTNCERVTEEWLIDPDGKTAKARLALIKMDHDVCEEG